MTFRDPPPTAAWRHIGARSGFEVAYFRDVGDGWRIEGCATALEGGQTWVVGYEIDVDGTWCTRQAHISAMSVAGPRSIMLEADGIGHWRVDGADAGHLDGCLDVDLESSAVTNALPVRRMRPAVGARSAAPAAYVRALDLAVDRLEQTYQRVGDSVAGQCYDYAAPVFGFACLLVYDDAGLVLDYPGIATRVI